MRSEWGLQPKKPKTTANFKFWTVVFSVVFGVLVATPNGVDSGLSRG